MATATEQVIRESWGVIQESLRVDRDKHTVYGAKLVSVGESRNRRRYLGQSLREAASLYEGAKINDDHPDGGATKARKYGDRMGNVLKGSVEFREGSGLHGDLRMNPKHALYEQFMFDAENAPQNVALSHNVLALQRLESNSGIWVVEKITRVISVDVVGDPGSTNGLFESEDFDAMKTVQKTLRVLLAEAVPTMQPAYEAIMVANGIDLAVPYNVAESAKPVDQLTAALEANGLAALRESTNAKRFDVVRTVGLLGDDIRAGVAPAAEKYKGAGSAAPAAVAAAAGAAAGGGTSDLAAVLEKLEAIGTKLNKLDQKELAESILEKHGVAKTSTIVNQLIQMSSKEAMELFTLQNLVKPSNGINGEYIARESAAGDGKIAADAKSFLSRIKAN
jgi:hypothetical protein